MEKTNIKNKTVRRFERELMSMLLGKRTKASVMGVSKIKRYDTGKEYWLVTVKLGHISKIRRVINQIEIPSNVKVLITIPTEEIV